MINRGKVKAKFYCIAVMAAFTLICLTTKTWAQKHGAPTFGKYLTLIPKSTLDLRSPWIAPPDTIPAAVLRGTTDSVTRYSFYSKDTLSSTFSYTADDSVVVLIPTKEILLYNKANVKSKQEDIDLTAQYIHYNQQNNLITAYGGTDTAKGALNKPIIVQQGSKTLMDTITINTKTQRLLTKNTYYNEGEIFVHADIVKTVDKKTAYAWRGRFTTCNLDTPHFDFRAKKLKLIKNNIAVSGPAYPEFEGVPMPIILPFGIFPLERGRHSGFLPPQFVNNDSYGLGLEGLGYYKVFNDNWDLTTRANLYTYGGYTLTLSPRYYKRYHYSGSLNLQIQHTVLLNSSSTYTDNEFTRNNSFQINWSHSMDSKARPGVSFSASVSGGSTQFNRYVANNALKNVQNQMSSSITWAKTWGDGKYNLSVAANHNQNNNTRLVNINMPTVNFSMNTRYPFARKEAVGQAKWYEKLGISYSGTMLNQIAFYDSAFSFKHLLDTANWGATHSLPITLSLPSLGPVTVAPSISYSENWYSRSLHTQWDSVAAQVDTSTLGRGFYRAYQTSFGLSFSTRIFGNYNFKPSSSISTIHHEIRPNIAISYTPNTNSKNYYWLRTSNRLKDSIRNNDGSYRYIYGDSTRVSRFAGNVVGAYSEGQFGGITFGLDNILEMKKRKQHKEGEEASDADTSSNEKVKLIDGLSINSGYNFLADSLQWQTINISFRTTLFKKLNINGSGVIDPYDVDRYTGNRINKLLWKQGSIGRFTSGNIALSGSFQSKKADEKKKQEDSNLPYDPTMSLTDQQNQLNYVRNNPSEFVDFDIPWNVSTSLAFNFSRILGSNYRYYTNITSSLNLNGDFSISPKWKAGGNVMFDIKNQKVGLLTLFFSREMHCWQMSINLTPIGPYKSFSIVLNPKSGILRDLRINRSRYFYNN